MSVRTLDVERRKETMKSRRAVAERERRNGRRGRRDGGREREPGEHFKYDAARVRPRDAKRLKTDSKLNRNKMKCRRLLLSLSSFSPL